MLLEMNNICKIYHMGDSDLRVLNNVCFKVKEGAVSYTHLIPFLLSL